MGAKTKIQWTDMSWNPVRGCSRVSEGCRNCYAERMASRFCGEGHPYEGLITLGPKGGRWNGKTKFVLEHLEDPLRKTKPQMVFVNSMSDLFHESISDEDIAAVFGIMAASPQHIFQVLTKRPARMLAWFDKMMKDEPGRVENHTVRGCGVAAVKKLGSLGHKNMLRPVVDGDVPWPLPNVWMGVSAETQSEAYRRVPALFMIPAAVRWVSYEPALNRIYWPAEWLMMPGALDWIVVGGESGPGARPFNIDWARHTIEQCQENGVAVFMKQFGSMPVTLEGGRLSLSDRKGGNIDEFPSWARVRQFPEVAR